MTRPDGTPVNAVFGFANMLFRLMQDTAGRRPGGRVRRQGDDFRNEIYAAYKANRDEPPPELVPQFPLVREAARAFGLPVVEAEGLEADDLIATYARQARARGRGGDRRLVRQGPDAAGRRRDPDVGPDEAEGDRPRRGDRALRRRPGAGARRPGADRRHFRQRARACPASASRPQPSCCRNTARWKACSPTSTRSSSRSGARRCRQHAEQRAAVLSAGGLARGCPAARRPDRARAAAAGPEGLLPFLQSNGFRSLVARMGDLRRGGRCAAGGRARGAECPRALVHHHARAARHDPGAGARAGPLRDRAPIPRRWTLSRAELVGVSLAVEPQRRASTCRSPMSTRSASPARGQLDRGRVLERLRPVLADPRC